MQKKRNEMKPKSLLRKLFMLPLLAGVLGGAGCGGDTITTVVSGTWKTPMGANPPSGYSAYSATLTFTGFTDTTYALTDTVAGTGSQAGCMETVNAAGSYLLQDGKLIVVFTSGTVTRTGCTNAASNVATRPFDTTDKALYTALVSGNYSISGTTLTIGITVMGVTSSTTYTKQ